MDTPRERRPSRLRKLAVSLVALAVGALLVEGVVRARQWVRLGSPGRHHAFTRDPASGLMIPVPGRSTLRIQIDSLGFRNPELERPKPEGRLRLAFIGASTTFCAETSGNESTWPHRVRELLAEAHPDADLDYVNAGVGGYPIEKSLINLRQRVQPLEPDAIVIYHAVNDISRNSRELARASGVYAGHADEDSWLARWSLTWYLIEKNLLLRRRQERARLGEERLEVAPGELGEPFRDDLTELVRAAQDVAPLVVLVTFSHRVRAEQSAAEKLAACNTALYYMPYMTPEAVLAAFDECNRVVREVAARTGALLVEGELEIPADGDHFNDSVHLLDAGCELQAQRIVRVLERERAIESLLP